MHMLVAPCYNKLTKVAKEEGVVKKVVEAEETATLQGNLNNNMEEETWIV